MSNIQNIPHGLTVYPWKRWENQKTHRARAGKHFTCKPEAFRRALFTHARRNELKVVTRVNGNTVTFQFSAK